MAMDLKKTIISEGLDKTLKVQTTDSEDVDRAGTETEVKWVNENWEKYNAYYKKHLSSKATINKVGMWSIGTGYTADDKTKKILDKINGWGKDTFDEILDNQIRVKHVNGDSYAEIIREKGILNLGGLIKGKGKIINLKPLNPGSIGHVINPQGILEGYKQKNIDGSESPFKLDQIFHLSMNRTADEIHGTGDIESMITFLDKIKQIDEDMAVMFHRFVVPLVIWKLNTDDPVAMAKFQAQEKAAWNTGSNLIIPDTAVDYQLLEAGKGVGKIINPMEWRNKWTEEVIKGGGVPALIMAIESGTTEASSKMVYMAWQVVIDKEQKSVTNQIKTQLGFDINLPKPPKIDVQNVASDEKKDAGAATKIKPSETKATLPGKK